MKLREFIQYDKQVEFMNIAGQTPSRKFAHKYKELVEEEVKELLNAKTQKDRLDGFADVIVTNTGYLYALTHYPVVANFVETLLDLDLSDNNNTYVMINEEITPIERVSQLGTWDQLLRFKVNPVLTPVKHIAFNLLAIIGACKDRGIDLYSVLEEVYRSNFTKFVMVDGKLTATLDESGKVMKPNTFTPPNLERWLK